jgi:ABC-type transport system involved in cytochrome c biogenesis permease component
VTISGLLIVLVFPMAAVFLQLPAQALPDQWLTGALCLGGSGFKDNPVVVDCSPVEVERFSNP